MGIAAVVVVVFVLLESACVFCVFLFRRCVWVKRVL